MKEVLIAFVKEPQAGQVKTRLARDLGPELAAALYRCLAEIELRHTRPEPGEYSRLVCFSPPGAAATIGRWLPGETLAAQTEGDLGERMARAFEQVLHAGAERVAIVGSDVPWVSRAHVKQALGALDAHDLVLGPTSDGGYYLLALARPHPELFAGMPWSTPEVLGMTLERAAAAGLRVRLLEELEDIDTLADLRGAWPLLRPLLRPDPALVVALDACLAQAGTRAASSGRYGAS
jgi:hypothetical protein